MPSDLILPIPAVPPEIQEAVNSKHLAVFVGAGVSRVIGCAGWNELAKNLVKCCASMMGQANSLPFLNFRATEILGQYQDHKKTITICYDLLKEKGHEDRFYDELRKSFQPDSDHALYSDIYDHVYRLRGLFITTNADEHFDRLFEQGRIVCNYFRPQEIESDKLYHIHGSIKEPGSLIFTVPQYFTRYRDNPDFKAFLEKIFSDYVVLFVGYGMAEFELLDFIMMKYGPQNASKHFILLPFYRGTEMSALQFERYYHAKMGITVIPYEMDENGYNQLYYVMKEWSTTVNLTTRRLYDSYKEIEDIVEQYGRSI